MSRLSLKTLTLKKLPHGRFTFKVLIKRNISRTMHCDSNAGEIQQMRTLLRDTCVGEHRFKYHVNWNKKRVYTELYLTNAMDLAMLKLVHHDKFYKIYKIKVATPSDEPA